MTKTVTDISTPCLSACLDNNTIKWNGNMLSSKNNTFIKNPGI